MKIHVICSVCKGKGTIKQYGFITQRCKSCKGTGRKIRKLSRYLKAYHMLFK